MRPTDSTSTTVAITGSSGLVGRALGERLLASGHRVLRVVRRESRNEDEVAWDPHRGELDTDALTGAEAVVHLAGQGVADQRWTAEFKAKIKSSRVESTRTLARALLGMRHLPRVLVSASGVGCYGNTQDAWVDEETPMANTFLASVCEEWEREAQVVEDRLRAVQLRIGMVLSPQGGALKKMLPLFRMGLGGRLASGKQFVSWITLNDLVRVIEHAVFGDLSGPVNAVSPNPVTNADFTRTLARVLGRPAPFPVPAFALRMALGELAEEVIGGQRVRPRKLLTSGFRFDHAELEPALTALFAVPQSPGR